MLHGIDLDDARRRLRLFERINVVCWAATLATFVYPTYTWLRFGHVELGLGFVISAIANVALLMASVKVMSRVRFLKYQIRYFSSQSDRGTPDDFVR